MLGQGLPPLGLTENNSATFLKSGNACLDFFFKVVPHIDTEDLGVLLQSAWEEDALMALKLIFQLRGVRGTGKSDKTNFYEAALWLHKYHPKTLVANARLIAAFGYYKDLLEIVQRVVEGPEETGRRLAEKARHDRVVQLGKSLAKSKKKKGAVTTRWRSTSRHAKLEPMGYWSRKGAAAKAAKAAGTLKPQEERVAAQEAKDKVASEQASLMRKKKRVDLAKSVMDLYAESSKFKALHSVVAQVFAEQLARDLAVLKEEKLFNLSLAAKWAPSLDLSYDKRTLMCEAIACQLFPKSSHPNYAELTDEHYTYRVRERLRKEVLVPLRKKLEIPEVYMSARKWEELPYNRVPSVAMRTYKEIFERHNPERFKKFLDDVQAGKQKIAAGALLPHDIVKDAVKNAGQTPNVAELQWKRMVQDLKEKGKLSNCLAICDVSASMHGEPMEVCIALGLLVSELCEEPWKGHIITFSAQPQLQLVQGDTLAEKHSFTQRMEWDMNTDFQKVFDLILTLAVTTSLPPERMVKRLFVFSDMEFDSASTSKDWAGTDYMVIRRKFQTAGYGDPPEIVFWNLRASDSTPVVSTQSGVAMVSGFSKNLLKIFLEEDGVVNPMLVMKRAIAAPMFNELQVVD